MTNLQTIPLNKLSQWDGNVRKTDVNHGIAALAESIRSHGLLQPLLVHKAKRGKYHVVAGGRRLKALQLLAMDGHIGKADDINCIVGEAEANMTEVSLAENVMRENMHPADQFQAFRELVEQGETIADIAARFSVSEPVVMRRLKLGRLSPVILDAYRNGSINLEAAQAFTVSDDHESQERIFASLPSHQVRPTVIRQHLTDGEVPLSNKRMRFLGVDAYREAGGAIRQDLFDSDNEGFALDAALVDRLVQERLEALASEIAAEGWSWTEARIGFDYTDRSAYGRVRADRVSLSEEDETALEAASTRYDELVDELNADPENADLREEYDLTCERIDALLDKQFVYPDEKLETAGAIVTLDHNGTVDVVRGLVDPETLKLQKKAKRDADKEEAGVQLPASLTADLTAQRTATLGVELSDKPEIALAAIVHTLALSFFYEFERGHSCLKLSGGDACLESALKSPDTSAAWQVLTGRFDKWQKTLPENASGLWAWCLDQGQDDLLKLLALIAGLSVDTVETKNRYNPSGTHTNQLATALHLQAGDWFTPDADSFFNHLNRPDMIRIITDVKGRAPAPNDQKLKKAELAALAERELTGSEWLPEIFRSGDDQDITAQAA